MKQFNYKIKDEIGLHARPAGLLAKIAKSFSSTIAVEKDGKSANASRLIALMGLGIKKADEITVIIEGADEKEAYDSIKRFFEDTL